MIGAISNRRFLETLDDVCSFFDAVVGVFGLLLLLLEAVDVEHCWVRFELLFYEVLLKVNFIFVTSIVITLSIPGGKHAVKDRKDEEKSATHILQDLILTVRKRGEGNEHAEK